MLLHDALDPGGDGADDEELTPFVEVARGIMASQHPALLDAAVIDGLTLIFEMIHRSRGR